MTIRRIMLWTLLAAFLIACYHNLYIEIERKPARRGNAAFTSVEFYWEPLNVCAYDNQYWRGYWVRWKGRTWCGDSFSKAKSE